jgi:hypothetical protein
MKSALVVAIFGVAAGCGDNHHNNPDASTTTHDASIDAHDASISPDAAPIVCDYMEQHDLTNDFDVPPGIEPTGLTYTGATLSICGTVNTGSAHYNSTYDTIDVDNYGITVNQDSDVLITLTSNGSGVANMAAISAVELIAYSDQTSENVASSFWASPGGDHAIVSAHLPMGTYELAMQASDNPNSATVTGPAIPYAITISADQPTVRCTTMTGSANYVESNDGPNGLGHVNDTVEIDMNGDAIALGSGENTPENTMLSLAPSTDYLITGDAAAVTTNNDAYWDMDTYVITPGPNTDQLSVRLDWANQNANLDYYLFRAGALGQDTAFITASTDDASEFGTTAVVPGQAYWLSVGEFDTTMGPAVDAPYSITVCAETYVAPPN